MRSLYSILQALKFRLASCGIATSTSLKKWQQDRSAFSRGWLAGRCSTSWVRP
jgi:hypothetical protein